MRRLIMILCLLFLIVSSAWAEEFLDGNNLLKTCSNAIDAFEKHAPDEVMSGNDLARSIVCITYLRGILSLNDYYEAKLKKAEKPLFCRPPKVDIIQAARIVVKFLKDHPERLHEEGIILITDALHQAFPCK